MCVLTMRNSEEEKKLKGLEEQRLKMTKDLRVLELVDASLCQARRDLLDVTERLVTFTGVWGVVSNLSHESQNSNSPY